MTEQQIKEINEASNVEKAILEVYGLDAIDAIRSFGLRTVMESASAWIATEIMKLERARYLK